MLEPIEATTLDDLGEFIFTAEIPRPDGRIVRVKMRALSDGKAWEIGKSVKWPKPPVTDYKKIEGEALPVYDYQNENYLNTRREADRDLTRRTLAASLVLDIPGETLEEKAQALEKKLGQWAFGYLLSIVNKLVEIDQEAIERVARSFRSETVERVSGDAGDGPHAADARGRAA